MSEEQLVTSHDNCVHYQLVGGQAIAVDKDDWYDYCTNEED